MTIVVSDELQEKIVDLILDCFWPKPRRRIRGEAEFIASKIKALIEEEDKASPPEARR